MTTIHDPTTSPAAASLQPLATSVVPPAPAPGVAISDSWLLAWAVSRSGFPAVAAVGDAAPAAPGHTIVSAPRFGLHLACPLPMASLLKAMAMLRGRRAPRAVLLAVDGQHVVAPPYRERLHLDDQQHVVSIRRSFRKRHRPEGRPNLVGIVWKFDGPFADLRGPVAGPPWRTVRALFRRSKFGVVRHLIAPPPRIDDLRGDLLSQLTPASLRALAADLGFKPVADFCFAHPSAVVDPQALLRGPLFIEADVVVGPQHIHMGPGWVTPASPAVTLPSRPDIELDLGHAAGHVGAPQPPARAPYFVGPRLRRKPAYDGFKRAFDIAFALFALLITLPICLAVAVLIKLYDRGPIFFAHKRESIHGRPFGCLKFRTMVRDAEALKKKLRAENQVDGPQFKIAHDPRITPIGRFLRKTNIDELPQFVNVLLGDMSVVGPRPSPFEENQLCPAWREARLSVRPGITGLWQVSRSRQRGAADFQEWIYFDTQYVERRSFLLDLRILLLTIKELFGQGQ